jgi:hypothetical protein
MLKITPATAGPLTGFATLNINLSLMLAYIAAAMSKGVQYGFGAKDPNLGTWPIDYHSIDCSGFVRAALAYSTHGQTQRYDMPDGSFLEADWFAAQGFKKTSYDMTANVDEHVRVAIHRPNGHGGDPIGHIWLIFKGQSIESYGGHGPGRRAWNHQWFVDHVDECYVLC